MRKMIGFMLLASAATAPALAAPADRFDRQQAREERQQAREAARPERPERAERDARPERVQRDFTPQRPQFDAPARARAEAPQRELNKIRAARENRVAARDWAAPQRAERGLPMAQRPDRVMRPQVERQTARERIAERMGERRASRPAPIVSPTPRPGTQPPPPAARRPSPAPNWNSNWRYDRRYDWNDYRRRHRSLFNLGFYYDPFGWGYQPYQIGWRMWPNYYSSNFWLNDPWMYRLPYAPPGYRWIRYWDDAILVDTWSGQVVDVIYNFFW